MRLETIDSVLYDIMYSRVKEIIKNRGIDKICTKCQLNGKGCCEGCRHLGKKGCTIKSLSCALWFCWKAAKRLRIKDLKVLINIEKIENEKNWHMTRGSKEDTMRYGYARKYLLSSNLNHYLKWKIKRKIG